MEELKDVIARNLVVYRKNAGLTQQEIADKINYSDKAVSKWERGDGTPDVTVLKQIADIYGVTVNDFLIVHSDKSAVKTRGKTRIAKHWLVGLLSFGLVWFVATIVMVIGLLIRPDLPIAEYAYIVALPASMIVAVVFCCIWGRLWMRALSVSALVWSLCVMIDVVFSGLSGITLANSWLIYVMGAALQDVSCKELRKRAWNRLADGNYGSSLGVTFLGDIINGAAGIFTYGSIAYGTGKYYIDQQRGLKPKFETMFDGFSLYGSTLVTGLLQQLFLFFWTLLLFIPGIIKQFSYSMVQYVMVDFDLSGTEAITKSRELMNGYKWKLFKLQLSFIGWELLAGLLTFGIGLIFLMPYEQAASAEFYAELLKCHDIYPKEELVAEDNTF